MSQEGPANGLRATLERHWEKVSLGGVAALALVFLGAAFSAGPNKAAQRVDQAFARLEKAKRASISSLAGPVVAPVPRVAPIVDAVPPDPRTAGSPPEIEEPPPPPPRPATWSVPDLAVKEPVARVDGVMLAWNVVPSTPKPGVRTLSFDPATYFFRIERRSTTDANWTLLQPEAKAPQFLDVRATPNREYEYQVTLGSTDPAWNAIHPGGLTDRVGGPVKVRTARIWSFEFSQLQPRNPETGAPGTVYVKVVKYDPELGFVELQKVVQEGSRIDFFDGTTIHRVLSPKKNRTVEVDFECGAVLKSVRAGRPEVYARRVCTPKLNERKALVCEGPVALQESYEVVELDYTDEEGAPRKLRMPSGLGRKPDRLCDEHR